MKIGIEEEFIVVDPETLFYSPSGLRLATHVVYKDFRKTYKCSVELPFSSRSIPFILRNLKKAFTVFEIKTEPYEDIDTLHDELVSYRKDVADIVHENHLMVLSTGLHPLYSPQVAIQDSCAALHIHVDYKKENVLKLLSMVPFLISRSTNSPFLNGEVLAMSNRLQMSPHVGLPEHSKGRAVDLLHNRRLNTLEVRVLDAQITADDSLGLASMVKTISESDGFHHTLTSEDYAVQRDTAIRKGATTLLIPEDDYRLLADSDSYAKHLLHQPTGAEWQIDLHKAHGLSSVITSLWESFQQNRRTVKKSSVPVIPEQIRTSDLWYMVPYAPFLFLDKYKKCKRDVNGLLRFTASMFR